MLRVMCPCCGNYTHLVDYVGEPLFEICKVCFWQYDATAHDYPDKISGANRITLNNARKNYKRMGVCEEKFKDNVRPPLEEELAENNGGL